MFSLKDHPFELFLFIVFLGENTAISCCQVSTYATMEEILLTYKYHRKPVSTLHEET